MKYNPETQTSRGAIASELELILDTKFGSKKASEIYRKMLAYRVKEQMK